MSTIKRRVAFVCLWFAVLPLRAEVPDTVFLEELTWTEVRDALKAGKTTILLPTGGTEQNGPHMVLGKHNTSSSTHPNGLRDASATRL